MRSEKELIFEISRIGLEAKNVDDAAGAVQALLAREIGGATLLIDPVELGISSWAAKAASEFLDSREFPFRGLYTAPLMIGNERAGRLIACFGSFESPGEFLQRLAVHTALQFGQLLARARRKVISHAEAA